MKPTVLQQSMTGGLDKPLYPRPQFLSIVLSNLVIMAAMTRTATSISTRLWQLLSVVLSKPSRFLRFDQGCHAGWLQSAAEKRKSQPRATRETGIFQNQGQNESYTAQYIRMHVDREGCDVAIRITDAQLSTIISPQPALN